MSIRQARFPDDRASIDALLGAVERFDGYVPLTEDGELDYRRGPRRPGFVATAAGRVVGYAQLTDVGAVVTVELVVHPACRAALDRSLLTAALGEVGTGPVAAWASDTDMMAAAAAHGLREQRAVVQLVGGLPPVEKPSWPKGIEAAPFTRGRDEAELLELNRVAFAGHPDNAAWDAEVLAERMSRDWFDVAGIVTARRAERIVGACWTKVHPGRVGEVYWIAVHPGEQGRSIGRALALSGLWHLSERCDTATVYTESDNARAKNLYGGLGFRLLRVKRRMVR